MTDEQRKEILHALRHGREPHQDEEFEFLIVQDLLVIEPLIDKWIAEAYREGIESME